MADFENMVRLYFAGLGVTRLTTRASSDAPHSVNLAGIISVLAWRTLLSAKILNGSEPIKAKFVVDENSLALRCPNGIDVVDSQSCLNGLAWVLSEYEDGDLRGLDDLSAEIVRTMRGELPVQAVVNEYLLSGYQTILKDWTNGKALRMDKSAGLEVERG